MLLFNARKANICEMWEYFNTSNVTIQLEQRIACAKGEIHFNTSNVTIQPREIFGSVEFGTFQYI